MPSGTRGRAAATPPSKEFHRILLTSIGTPMLQMGDEMRRTQWGNNNAYCQDNEV